jgi:hypothetical protein
LFKNCRRVCKTHGCFFTDRAARQGAIWVQRNLAGDVDKSGARRKDSGLRLALLGLASAR